MKLVRATDSFGVRTTAPGCTERTAGASVGAGSVLITLVISKLQEVNCDIIILYFPAVIGYTLTIEKRTHNRIQLAATLLKS